MSKGYDSSRKRRRESGISLILNDSCPGRQGPETRAKPESIGGFSLAKSTVASTHPVILVPKKDVRRDVRRRDRGQRPTATEEKLKLGKRKAESGKLGTVTPGALTSSSADANALIRIRRIRRNVRRGVRRRDRGQRPTATEDPDTKQRLRRQRRHCSRLRRPRFPHWTLRPPSAPQAISFRQLMRIRG